MCNTLSYRGESLCPPSYPAVASHGLASGLTGRGQALELTFCALALAAPWGWRHGQRHGRACTGETLGEEDVREFGGTPLSKPVTKEQLEE